MGLLTTDFFRNALSHPWLVRLLKATVPRMDRFLLKISRGWLNTGLQSVALLRTTGARSGISREVATLCMPWEGGIVLVGSNWGLARDPAWVFNLRAHPQTHVTYRGFRGEMLAEELNGAQREAMWQRLVAFNPQYAIYQDGVSRQLPVIQLRRPDAPPRAAA